MAAVPEHAGLAEPPGSPARELRARGHRTRRRLLEAGSTVFAERGYHAARVDDVVKAARTSHGTFYLYFSSKEDLFRALAVEVATEMVALAAEFPALKPDLEGRAALRDWLTRFVECYERRSPVIRVWTEAEISDSEFGRIGGGLVGEFTGRLAARIRPAAPDLDPLVAAMAVVALIERSSYLVTTASIRADRETLLDTLANAVHQGVHGPTPGPRP
jgi:AcrR family transcriptional regulator